MKKALFLGFIILALVSATDFDVPPTGVLPMRTFLITHTPLTSSTSITERLAYGYPDTDQVKI